MVLKGKHIPERFSHLHPDLLNQVNTYQLNDTPLKPLFQTTNLLDLLDTDDYAIQDTDSFEFWKRQAGMLPSETRITTIAVLLDYINTVQKELISLSKKDVVQSQIVFIDDKHVTRRTNSRLRHNKM